MGPGTPRPGRHHPRRRPPRPGRPPARERAAQRGGAGLPGRGLPRGLPRLAARGALPAPGDHRRRRRLHRRQRGDRGVLPGSRRPDPRRTPGERRARGGPQHRHPGGDRGPGHLRRLRRHGDPERLRQDGPAPGRDRLGLRGRLPAPAGARPLRGAALAAQAARRAAARHHHRPGPRHARQHLGGHQGLPARLPGADRARVPRRRALRGPGPDHPRLPPGTVVRRAHGLGVPVAHAGRGHVDHPAEASGRGPAGPAGGQAAGGGPPRRGSLGAGGQPVVHQGVPAGPDALLPSRPDRAGGVLLGGADHRDRVARRARARTDLGAARAAVPGGRPPGRPKGPRGPAAVPERPAAGDLELPGRRP